MKKLIIALILSLLPSVAFGALVTVDDFTRANSTVVNDATHPWLEIQKIGEGAINNNQLELHVVNPGDRNYFQGIAWAGGFCSDGCEIRLNLGFTAATGSVLAFGIIDSLSDFGTLDADMPTPTNYVSGDSLVLRKTPNNGYITLHYHPEGQGSGSDLWTAGTEVGSTMTNGETEEAYIRFYKSGNNMLMDMCWGVVSNPCGEWSKTGFNLTIANSNAITKGFPILLQYDNTVTSDRTYFFDDFRLDIPEKSAYKPWLSGVTSSGITVHIKSSSTVYNTAVQYGTSPTLAAYTETTGVVPTWSNELITKNTITGLTANTKYYYRIKIGSTVDSNIYSFTTLPTAGTVASFRFGFGACTSESGWTAGIAQLLSSKNLLFFLGIGDFPYVDERYISERMGALYAYRKEMFDYPDWQTFNANVPVFYMWNDHDSGWDEAFGAYGNQLYTAGTVAVQNNANGKTCGDTPNPCTVTGTGTTWTNLYMGSGSESNYNSNFLTFKVSGDIQEYKVVSRTDTTLTLDTPYHGATGTGLSYQLFKEMRGIGETIPIMWDNKIIATGYDSDANYYSFQVGRTKFWAIDTQKYTSNYDDTDGPSKTMLGTNQKNWLLATYKIDSAPLKFFVSPEPVYTARNSSKQEWHINYNYEHAWLVSLLREATGKTMIITGDSHQMAYTHPDLIPSVLEVNHSKLGVINSSHSQLWTAGRKGWVEDWNAERRGIAIVDVNDNGTDIIATATFYYSDGSVARTVNFGTTTTRALICDYDATFCPNGRGAPQ